MATLRVEDGSVTVGPGVTPANVDQGGGSLTLRCAVTGAIDQLGGTFCTEDQGAVATWNLEGGTAVPCSVGQISTFNLNGGEADFLQSQQPQTVDTLAVGQFGARRLRTGRKITSVVRRIR